ncbi:MAG: hypothetical protein NC087_00745 [Anaeroplasma bactoclasticum]|nr:hypothetical protein [Anaeroplasma bactoclasticum]MCM1556039.1 hypothetical protein [Anaeroplasma bactoclasticum]
MKKLCISLLISVSFVGLWVIKGPKAVASEESVEVKCNNIVNVITEHLSEFKEEYNKDSKEKLEAVGAEGYSIAYIIDAESYGVYIDFNEDNGYLVCSTSYELYEVEPKGDIDYLKGVEFTYYSVIDGFLYRDGESYHKYIKEGRSADKLYKYKGKSGDGEGDIYDITAYMADRYPSYTLVSSYEDTYVKGKYRATSMLSTSYYIKNVSRDGGQNYQSTESESNCALTAAFNVMSSWKQMGYYDKFPLKTVNKDMREEILEDPNYEKYGTGVGGVGIDSYWTTNIALRLRYMPELYYFCNYYSTAANHYTPESGLTTAQAREIFIFCTSQYMGGTKYPYKSTNFSDVMTSLQEGRAVFMGVSGSKTFGGDHAVALLGYRQYSYKTGVWIFSQTKTAYFFMIDDGHTESITYFDPSGNSKLSYEFVYI